MPNNKFKKKKKKKNITESWFSRVRGRFSNFFSRIKTAFLELFNFNQEEENDNEDEEFPQEPSQKLSKKPSPEPSDPYQEACNKAVREAQVGDNFTVPQEELEALKKVEDACRKTYQDRYEHKLSLYVKRHSKEFPLLLDKNSALYKEASYKVSKYLKKSPQKLALDEAGKTAQALREKHAIAFGKAILAYGQGKLLKLNGICLERIQDVGGLNNNCGANVMMHIFVEHWDKLNFEDKNIKSLGEHLLSAAKAAATSKNEPKSLVDLKNHIDSFSFSKQEKIFTPAVRAHLGETLAGSEEYFQMWVAMQLSGLDKYLLHDEAERTKAYHADCNWDRALFTSKEYHTYYPYRFNSPQEIAQARIPERIKSLKKTAKYKEASELEKEVMKKEIGEQAEKEQVQMEVEKADLERTLFNSRYKRLGDEKNAIQIADYELYKYAEIMGVDMRVYVKEGNLTKPLYNHHPENAHSIKVIVVNLSAFHWQYVRKDKPVAAKAAHQEPIVVLPPPPVKADLAPIVEESASPAVPEKKPGPKVPPKPPSKSKAP